jgi:hypothetical protein
VGVALDVGVALELGVCDEGDDDEDGVTTHAERTMADKVRKKLDFNLECI